MKARRRILDIRRHSRVSSANSNLWFFSEDSSNNQSLTAENKSVRNDHMSVLREDYDRYFNDYSIQEKNKKECNFIVDWQMSDKF